MINLTFRNINRSFGQLFQAGHNDPTRNYFVMYYISLEGIKGFNVLIENKPFFDPPVKTNKRRMKNLLKYQEIMTKQQENF